jgi:prepilin-type N-terminal cleavage/methylation domain-containing protein
MRRRGYALSELLVAIAIAGLIIGILTFINVDYITLGRRVGQIQGPYRLGTRAERGDPCAMPGGVLTAEGDKLIVHGPQDSETVLTLLPQDPDAQGGTTQVITPTGVAGSSSEPVRAVVEATTPQGAAPAPGASMAWVEIGGKTVAVIAPRCELSQICEYDPANAMCQQDEVHEVAEPG